MTWADGLLITLIGWSFLKRLVRGFCKRVDPLVATIMLDLDVVSSCSATMSTMGRLSALLKELVAFCDVNSDDVIMLSVVVRPSHGSGSELPEQKFFIVPANDDDRAGDDINRRPSSFVVRTPVDVVLRRGSSLVVMDTCRVDTEHMEKEQDYARAVDYSNVKLVVVARDGRVLDGSVTDLLREFDACLNGVVQELLRATTPTPTTTTTTQSAPRPY